MRFLLVSADQPSVKKYIDIPDRLVKRKPLSLISKKKSGSKMKQVDTNSKIKQNASNTKTKRKPAASINKPNQASKPIIRKNGSIHHRDKQRISK